MNDNKLLELLQQHAGEFLSGEELSRRLSISRTAVWKQINKLREEGYEFEAVSRKGYRLLRVPDRLEVSEIQAALTTTHFGREIKLLDVTETTQIEARKLAEAGAQSGTLVIAEEQTGARGRQGRHWFSPARKGVWMSMVLRPNCSLSFAPQLTLLTAVAVCRAIRKVSGVDAGIKWPNDLLVEGRKICGILIESVGEDELIKFCIVGIGIDVNLDEFDVPDELKEIATSLKMESGREIDRAALIGTVMNELEQLYELYLTEGFAPIGHLWEALSVTLGRRIKVRTPQGEKSGLATALDPSGALTLMDDRGEMYTIYSGEVQLGG
ncbi:Bifunctional ligase/repressor BirA [compost metagenome]